MASCCLSPQSRLGFLAVWDSEGVVLSVVSALSLLPLVPCRSSSMRHVVHQNRPSSCNQLRTQEQEHFGHLRLPKGAVSLQSQVDDASDGTLHGSTSLRDVGLLEGVVLHPRRMLVKMSKRCR